MGLICNVCGLPVADLAAMSNHKLDRIKNPQYPLDAEHHGLALAIEESTAHQMDDRFSISTSNVPNPMDANRDGKVSPQEEQLFRDRLAGTAPADSVAAQTTVGAEEAYGGPRPVYKSTAPAVSLAPQAPAGWSESMYLKQNPDVSGAVSAGNFSSGLEHYNLYGKNEGRQGSFIPADFSDKMYLAQNPDVAAAVSRGEFSSGLDHYLKFGGSEGRQGSFTPAGFNEQKYLQMYPDVAAAVASGDIKSGLEHYLTWGFSENRPLDGPAAPTPTTRVVAPVEIAPPIIDIKRDPIISDGGPVATPPDDTTNINPSVLPQNPSEQETKDFILHQPLLNTEPVIGPSTQSESAEQNAVQSADVQSTPLPEFAANSPDEADTQPGQDASDTELIEPEPEQTSSTVENSTSNEASTTSSSSINEPSDSPSIPEASEQSGAEKSRERFGSGFERRRFSKWEPVEKPPVSKVEAPATYTRDTSDSGFAYPWSAARSTGTSDIIGTISKALSFMNSNEGKDYRYDKVKGAITTPEGNFISKDDVQALNNVILKYQKVGFSLGKENRDAGITKAAQSGSSTGVDQKKISSVFGSTAGAEKIGDNTSGLRDVGNGFSFGGGSSVKHGTDAGFKLP